MSDKMSDKVTKKEKAFLEMLMKQLMVDEYVTTALMSKITNISISTVRRYMAKFCELDVIITEGKNKGKKYFLNKTNQNLINFCYDSILFRRFADE